MPANPQVTDEMVEKAAKNIARTVPFNDGGWIEPHGHNFPEQYTEDEQKKIRAIAFAAITAALADHVMGWRDIESAPEERALFGYRNQFGGWHSQTFDGPWEPRKYGYTHWMPLPAAPLPQKEG